MTSQPITKESTDRFDVVDGIRIHYNEAGSGPALLCFHGGGSGANAWGNTRFNIAELAKHFTVILVDLPGYGESAKDFPLDPNEYRDSFNARIVKGLMDVKGIRKAHFYASSMGGYVGIRFAIDYPDRLDKLVLQAAGPNRDPVLTPRPLEGIKALGEFVQHPDRAHMEAMMRLFIPDDDLRTPELVEERWRAASRPGHVEFQRRVRGMRSSVLLEDARNVKHPVLVLWGANDRMVPLDESLANLWVFPNVRLHIWGHAGHFIQYEKTDEFNRTVIDFLTH
ncbi:MAG: alpha/beta fold hydrolase [SAR202 cluster bacterium]|nr:alpha/beta fold hydrolase [SAR202 cluster bacterium]